MSNKEPTQDAANRSAGGPRYRANTSLLELIYGITFEIWEERGVELIRSYYASDIEMFALGGVTLGVEAIVQGTYSTLEAFSDRVLLAENVVWSEDADGDYSSHRIISPMTNTGETPWGPATQRKVQVRTVADCLVHDGKIIREWLMRDNLPAVQQLGFDPVAAAGAQAAQPSAPTRDWWAAEFARVEAGRDVAEGVAGSVEEIAFARETLEALWGSGDERVLRCSFPHYAVAHPTPLQLLSGRKAIIDHYTQQRQSFSGASITVDHVASQPWGREGREVAVRWSVAATHSGGYLGLRPTGKPVYVLGTSHWRLIEGRIATEWTVFDGMGVLAQLV